MPIDPVCKRTVDDETAPAHDEYRGLDYFFCSVECRDEFQKGPEQYVSGQAA